MPNETKYVRGESNSNFESMTKEEILAAIVQAVQGGTIGDVDTGFVTTIKEQNKNAGLKFWVGTTAEYEALATKENNVLYIKTDDTLFADLNNAITDLQSSVTNNTDAINGVAASLKAFIYDDDYSLNLTNIIDNANTGITMYHVMGVGMDKGYPVNATAGINNPWLHVCLIKYDDYDALVIVEYDGAMYYAVYSNSVLGSWYTITSTT